MKLSFFNSPFNAAKTFFVFAAFVATTGVVRAQDDSTATGPEPVTRTFRGPQLINMPTNEIVDGLTFGIQHRFGQVIDKDIAYEFLGMDLTANMRFSLGYPIIKERLMVELGRTKFGKNMDLEVKWLALRQTTKNEMPISLTIYVDPSLSMTRFPKVPNYAYFGDSTTVFKYTAASRMAYNSQIIISRKFSKKFSCELAPTFIYRNLVESSTIDHYTMALQAGARYKFSRAGSIMVEYGHAFNNRDTATATKTVDPLSIGVEFGTVAHVFQIVMSSSNNLLARDIYTTNGVAYTKGLFVGFNLKRFF
ncbi:MAG: DUF5777 family beta-barrel protein [Bacteroidetes bacterium]|nr:DUF5777 family beta-barrel protein [Bacteroidota bacterium]